MKIRILHVIATLDPAGAENQLVRLALGLDRARFSCFVCCLTRGGALEEKLLRGGIPCVILHKQAKCDPLVLFRLTRLVRKLRPHIVHTWLFTSNAYGRTAAILGGAPVRVTSELSVDGWKRGPYLAVDRLLLPFTDAVTVNAEAVRRFYASKEHVPPSRMVLIRNGIDLAVFRPRPREQARTQFGLPPEAAVIGGAGRLDPQKGFGFLLEAMPLVRAEVAGARLIIAGEGHERRRLEDQVDRLGLRECVRLLGHVEDMAGFMSAIDVFALPSLWEGLPHVVMEAMACGRPVVAARAGGADELVEEGATGHLVEPRSPTALAGALVRLLRRPDETRTMGARAQAVARKEFDFMKMVRQTEALYLSLIERRNECAGS